MGRLRHKRTIFFSLSALFFKKGLVVFFGVSKYTIKYARALQREKKRLLYIHEKDDKNGIYLFIFYFFIEMQIYNLYSDEHDIYNIS